MINKQVRQGLIGINMSNSKDEYGESLILLETTELPPNPQWSSAARVVMTADEALDAIVDLIKTVAEARTKDYKDGLSENEKDAAALLDRHQMDPDGWIVDVMSDVYDKLGRHK